jgi:DNA-binding transcriptional MerR regulator
MASSIKIPDRIFFRIGDVAEILGVKPYVLRYWETEFSLVSPEKSSAGQRVYRRSDVEALMLIKHLRYEERYSIEGARKRIRDLRKSGELSSFKQDKIAETLDDRKTRVQRIKTLTRELQILTEMPLERFFQIVD